LLPVIEKELLRPCAPPLGKTLHDGRRPFDSLYEKLPEFVALSRKFDPRGKFHIDFLNTNVFGVAS